MPGNKDPQLKIALVHQNLAFSQIAINLTWKVLNERGCALHQLAARQSCILSSNTMVLINRTKQDTIAIEPEIISNFTFFYLTVYDEQGNQCKELFLESFRFGPKSKFLL